MNCYDALLLCHNLVFSLSCCTEHFCDSATAVHWSLSLTKLSVESCVSRTAARAALSLSFARLGRSVECTTGGELHSNEDVSSGWSRVLLSAAAQLCLEKFQLKCPRNSFEKEIEILFFYGSLSRHAKFQRQINETQNHFSYCAIHCCSRLRISVAAFWLNKPLFTKSFSHFFRFLLILISDQIGNPVAEIFNDVIDYNWLHFQFIIAFIMWSSLASNKPSNLCLSFFPGGHFVFSRELMGMNGVYLESCIHSDWQQLVIMMPQSAFC